MPFDPSIPFKVDLPEPHRPIERYLTLRDMMDQRRVRESQMRRLEMQEEMQDDELRERQGLRNLFSSNPDPKPLDILRVAPLTGHKVVQGLYEQTKERRLSEKAAAELEEQKRKNEQARRVILRNRQFALLQEPDETKRQKLWGELAPELVELELSSPEEAAAPAPDLATLERMAGQYFVATEGPEAWQKYQSGILTERDNRTKASLERSLKQIELAGHFAGTVKDQPSYDRWMSLLPDELKSGLNPTFSPESMQHAQDAMLTAQQRAQLAKPATAAPPALFGPWYEGWLARNGAEDTPENRSLGVEEYNRQTRPQFAQPGVDVPLSPQVEAQRIRMGQAAATDKPLSAEGAKVKAIAETMVPEARQLAIAIRKGGRAAIAGILTGSDVKLSRLAEQVADKIGRMRSGGAVNKQEEQRFMAQISRVADLFAGPDAAVEAIESYINEANQVVGGMTRGGQPPAAPPAAPAKPARVRWGRDAQGNPVELPQ